MEENQTSFTSNNQPIINNSPDENETITQEINNSLNNPAPSKFILGIIIVLTVLSGVVSGYYLAGKKNQNINQSQLSSNNEIMSNPRIKLVESENRNRDCAQGVLKKNKSGQIEGTHILNRGRPDQTVNILSSSMILSSYEDKKVEVCGETLPSQKSAWLLDAGQIKELK